MLLSPPPNISPSFPCPALPCLPSLSIDRWKQQYSGVESDAFRNPPRTVSRFSFKPFLSLSCWCRWRPLCSISHYYAIMPNAKGKQGLAIHIMLLTVTDMSSFFFRMMPISRFASLPPAIAARSQPQLPILPSKRIHLVVVCGARGPRPRFPRVWKTRKRIGTISKSNKLVDCIKGLSNVKEEVYGALDSFIAWELEFPLIVVKKALKTLETEKEWKRIIQVIKWMLSKGQGKTMGTYYTLLNAMIEDDRLEEAEELWSHLFSKYLESLPRVFFMKMISVYYEKDMHEKMFEIFADMEELGMRPDGSIVNMMGDVFQKLNMLDKYEKLKKKYPPPKWEYRYKKGKRIRIKVYESENTLQGDASVKALDGAENAYLNENREQ